LNQRHLRRTAKKGISVTQATAADRIEVVSSRFWASFHFNVTRWLFPTRMIADHIGISTREVRFWLTPWARTDDHLPLSHIAEVLHRRGLFWDAISVESSGGANPLTITGVSKFHAGSFVEHVRERLNTTPVTAPR
jgi:hypothetical protein